MNECLFFAVCETNGQNQYNEKVICEDWFDYINLCHDSCDGSTCDPCDGSTRMSLLPDTVTWMNTQGLTPIASVFCASKAPWPLHGSNEIDVQLVCQQICDYCPPPTTTTSTTTTSTTTTENTGKTL